MMAGPPPGQPPDTALIDALLARALHAAPPGQPELEGTGLPNPDPQSAPPIYGELPGEGYLFARDPSVRQSTLIQTTPDFVRAAILSAMETVAFNAQLPLDEEGAAKNAEALLRMAQAYLLIDPLVDAQGIPVAGGAMAQAAGQVAAAAGQPQPAPSGEAHGTVKKEPGRPPRVQPGAAAQAMREMHEPLEDILKSTRGSRPLPQPRAGA